MTEIQYHIALSTSDAIDEAIKQWEMIAKEAIEAFGRFNVILSGGETPAPFYRRLNKVISQDIWDRTYIFLADERCVGGNNAGSNRLMLEQTLLSSTVLQAEHLQWPEIKSTDTPAEAASRYEAQMKDFFNHGPAHFDIALLGIGQDGHTASLFPGDAALGVEDKWAVGVNHPGIAHPRITLTRPVLFQSKHIFFLVFGASKSSVLKKFYNADKDVPARQVCEGHGSVTVFTDQAAMNKDGI